MSAPTDSQAPPASRTDWPDSIVGRVFHFARASPDTTALIIRERQVPYGELAQRVSSIAAQLSASGLQAGERVILPASNSLHFVANYLAVHACGAIAVPLDPAAPRARQELIRERVAARLLLTPAEQKAGAEAAGDGAAAPRVLAAAGTAGPRPGAIADIMFTSGTTGAPKGVMLDHAGLFRAAIHINAVVGTRQDDIEILALPLAHSFGLGSLRCLLSVGACAVLIEGFAFPGQIFDALERHRATGLRSVPAGLATLFRLSRDKLGEFADQLRYLEFGSAPMQREDKQRLLRLLPRTRLCMHYGLTEATLSVYTEFHSEAEHLDSIGRPAPGVEVHIRGEQGDEMPANAAGEICIRGPHVMRGYWQDPERSATTLMDGWLRTGDYGHRDEQGRLYLTGRKSDMINVGGRKLSPIEVEAALRSHPAVKDCACVGIPDPDGIAGEIVAVVVVLHAPAAPEEKTLRHHLRVTLEPYKIPTQWAFVDTLPYTANGKVQRHVLRDQFAVGGA
jgi:long-chain acyl-CoA synthetase